MADRRRKLSRLSKVTTGLGLWSGLSRGNRRLLISSGALLFAMMMMLGIATCSLWIAVTRDATGDLDHLSLAIGEQTDRSFEEVDFAVILLRNMVETGPAAAVSGPTNNPVGPSDLYTAHFNMPQASGFAIAGSDGQIISHTPNWPAAATPDQSPGFMNYLRTDNNTGLFLGRPFFDGRTNTWFVYIARPLSDRHGTFAGVAIGLINLNYFTALYRTLIGRSEIAIILFSHDGITLSRYDMALTIGRRPARLGSSWDRIVTSGQHRRLVARSLTGAARRIIWVTPLRDFPLVVNVSISKAAALEDWWTQTVLTVAGTGCAALGMVLLLRAIMLQMRRLERSEASLAEQSALLTTTLENITDGVTMVDADGRIVVCNARATTLLGLPAGLVTSRPSAETILAYQRKVHDCPDDAVADVFLNHIPVPGVTTTEHHRPNGTVLEIRSRPLADGSVIRTYTDVTERRRSEARIRFLAHHDPLTGLANRTLFAARLQQEFDRADSNGHSLAVFYFDLDRFKFVNDTRGHAAGDQLLIEIAGRLRQVSQDVSAVARMGGDEFAAILLLDQPGQDPTHLARPLIEDLQRPIALESSFVRIGVSMGIALYPGHARNVGDLIRNADMALYRAKTEGTGLYRVFDATMQARQTLMFEREQALRVALAHGQFALAYQPIVNTDDGRMVGCEALLRWHHPVHGPVPPADLVSLAERIGLIVQLGHWVLETACQEAASWPSDTYVAVNLSPLQMNETGLVHEIKKILAMTGLAPERLTLEITEGSLLQDNTTVRTIMQTLRGIGIRFSLDDFGTGHSGIGYLHRFPFDGIKIDKLFVQDMVEQRNAAAIVGALLTVSAELQLDVIAEGVETEAQFNALKERRCRLIQGRYTAWPLTSAEIIRFIAAHNAPPV